MALGGSVLAFLVAVLGSWVRINGAGLTCPDWPLCRGAVVPALHGGVVLEWAHRAGVLLVTLLVIATLVQGWPLRRSVAGLGPALASLPIVLGVQIALGGATVLLGNSPLSVMLHWAAGMTLFAAFTALAVLSSARKPSGSAWRLGDPVALSLAAAAFFAFVTMSAGAYVGSSFAGLACTTFPACDGSLLGATDPQRLQMFHRLAAGTLGAFALLAAVLAFARAQQSVRIATGCALALVTFQVVLGALNVALSLPVELRALHAANASLVFVAFVVAALLAALEAPAECAIVEPVAIAAREAASAP
ncbi:MAG: COX15/CtaA family protein [Candidatus Eremiobacteraeota bacterium]|nr:COX15/CtaA family protein [Candidatus Eremiobacteraeota bacterium]